MSTGNQHGVRVTENNAGVRPVGISDASTIAIVGTAPGADETLFPLDTPVAIYGTMEEAAPLGTGGTLYNAIDLMFKQKQSKIVVIRVEEVHTLDSSGDAELDEDGNTIVDYESTRTKIIGGYDVDGVASGIEVCLNADAITGLTPRLLVVPGYTSDEAVASPLLAIANKLRAVVILDVAKGSTPQQAQDYRAKFDDARAYVVYPHVKTLRDGKTMLEPLSSAVAGLFVKRDTEVNFAASPSNQTIKGITGMELPIAFRMGDTTCLANVLNFKQINVVINYGGGYRFWGNRSCSSDVKWAFINQRRVADIINDSIQASHLWAVDKSSTAGLVTNVLDSVNAFMDDLGVRQIILGGSAWTDSTKNTNESLSTGKLFIDFDFTAPAPVESIEFQSTKTNSYYSSIL